MSTAVEHHPIDGDPIGPDQAVSTRHTDQPDSPGTADSAGRDQVPEYLRRRREVRRARLRRLLIGSVGVAVAVAVWQLAALSVHDDALVPTVPDTFSSLFRYLHSPYPTGSTTLFSDVLISSRRVLLGFFAGAVIGVLLGSLMASSRAVRHLVDPLVGFFRPIPPLAFIPLLIVWLGIGESPKLALIILGVVPIIVVATIASLDRVPIELLQAGRALGASPLRTLFLVRLRAASSGIITGLRIALAGAWTSIVAAEMLGATAGLGYKTQTAGVNLQLSIVFAGILLIATIGILMDASLRLLLRFVDPSVR
jgi:ABC-type nitrate/sulfonate/bicarbonate transport system permease component